MTQNKALGYIFNVFDKGKSVKAHFCIYHEQTSIDKFGMWRDWIMQNYQEGFKEQKM